MKRILMLALVLALLATMIITTATFACGVPGAQVRNGNAAQLGGGNGAGDGTGPIHKCLDLDLDGVCGKP
jgi:hypothetical protein